MTVPSTPSSSKAQEILCDGCLKPYIEPTKVVLIACEHMFHSKCCPSQAYVDCPACLREQKKIENLSRGDFMVDLYVQAECVVKWLLSLRAKT